MQEDRHENQASSSADEAKERRVDETVCRVAHRGNTDRCYPYKFKRIVHLDAGQSMEVRVSFLTGARTSSVHHSKFGLVYETKGNGGLTCFRKGKWLDVLEALAFDLENEARAEEALRQATAQVDKARRFEPLED